MQSSAFLVLMELVRIRVKGEVGDVLLQIMDTSSGELRTPTNHLYGG